MTKPTHRHRHDFQQTAHTFAEKQVLRTWMDTYFTADDRLLLTVSGGPDSMCMASLVCTYRTEKGYDAHRIHIVHCDHQVRNTDAEKEMIKSFFGDWQYHICRRDDGQTQPTEAQLRKRRYAAWNNLVQKHHITKVITGHNLTDRIESSFLNLLRGASLRGFLAMQPYDTHHLLAEIDVCRPLLSLTKARIHTLCHDLGIPYIIDPTNMHNDTSRRNKLRNDVLPLLYALSHKHTATTNTFVESMQHVYDTIAINPSDYHLISIAVSPYRNAQWAYKRTGDIKKITTHDLNVICKDLHIYHNIRQHTIRDRCKRLHDGQTGHKHLGEVYMFIAHGQLYFINAPKDFWKKSPQMVTHITTLGEITRGDTTVSINNEKYIGNTLRYARQGDKYGSKSRTKRCINCKIPIFRRNFIPLATDEQNIINAFVPSHLLTQS